MKLIGRSSARIVLPGLLALTLIAVALWLAFNLTFPARARPLPGTPYTLRIQPGVPDADVRLVTDSLHLSARYFTQVLENSTLRSVDVKFARFSPCIPFFPLRKTSTAVAAANRICINTVYNGWPTTRRNRPLAVSLIAHEHFHTLQGQLKCLPALGKREYAWWTEGSATYVGWRTALHAGLTTEAEIEREMRRWGEFNADLRPLQTYERAIGGDAEYALAARAVGELVKRAGPGSLVTFCEQVGQGVAWRTAFEDVFGVGVTEFYSSFERQRTAQAL